MKALPEDHLPPDLEPSMDEAVEHLRESARIMRSLGRISAGFVPDLEGAIKADESAKQHEKEVKTRNEQKGSLFLNELERFVGTLPQADAETVGRETLYRPKDRYRKLEVDLKKPTFKSESLEEVRLLETQVWWVDAVKKSRQSYLWDPEAYEKAAEKQFRVLKEEGEGDIERPSVLETPPPYYVVGERMGSTNEDQSDAFLDLLLMRATDDGASPRLIVARTSNRLRDIADKLALDKLEKRIDMRSLENYRCGEGEYKVPIPSYSFHKQRVITRFNERTFTGKKKHLELPVVPKKDSKVDHFWSDRESEIRREGLKAEVRVIDGDKIGMRELETFNIGYHAQKLAIMLDREESYQDAFSLSKKGQS